MLIYFTQLKFPEDIKASLAINGVRVHRVKNPKRANKIFNKLKYHNRLDRKRMLKELNELSC